MSTKDEFSCFISYSRTDNKFAQKLQKSIERYRVPRKLVGAMDKTLNLVPARPAKCCRDITDFNTGPLNEIIQEKLNLSKLLVVICSPHATTEGSWVDQEIRWWQENRSVKSIIPLVIGGKPNISSTGKKSPTEALPPALRVGQEQLPGGSQEELLWLDVRNGGFNIARFRILASILDLDFDDLYRRHQRYVRNIFVTFMSVAIIVITSLSALSWVAIDQRNKALANNSVFKAEQSRQALKAGASSLAARISLEALPNEDVWRRPYVWQANVSLGLAYQELHEIGYFDHQGTPVAGAALLEDEATLFSVTETGVLYRWNTRTQNVTGQWPLFPSIENKFEVTVTGLVHSRTNNKLLISNSAGTLAQFDISTATTRLVKVFQGKPISCLTISTDGGRVVSTNEELPPKTWNSDTLELLEETEFTINISSWCTQKLSDGGYLAGGSDADFEYGVLVRTNSKGEEIWRNKILDDYYSYIAVAPLETIAVATTIEGEIHLLNLDNNTIFRTLSVVSETQKNNIATAVAFSSDGSQLLVGDNSGAIHIWEVATGKKLEYLTEQHNQTTALAVGKENYISTSSDGSARLWSFQSPAEKEILTKLSDNASIARFSPDESILVFGTFDGEIQVLSMPSKTIISRRKLHDDIIRSIDISNNGLIATAGGDGKSYLWKFNELEEPIEIYQSDTGVSDVRFYGVDQNIIIADFNGKVVSYNIDEAKVNHNFESTLYGPVNSIDITKEGKLLTHHQRGRSVLWSLHDRTKLKEFSAPEKMPESSNITKGFIDPFSRWAVLSHSDNKARLYDLESGKLIKTLPHSITAQDSLTFDPKGRWLSTQPEKDIVIWDSVNDITVVLGEAHTTSAATFIGSVEDSIATVNQSEGVRLWDLGSGKPYIYYEAKDSESSMLHGILSSDKHLVIYGTKEPKIMSVLPRYEELIKLTKSYLPKASQSVTEADKKRFYMRSD